MTPLAGPSAAQRTRVPAALHTSALPNNVAGDAGKEERATTVWQKNTTDTTSKTSQQPGGKEEIETQPACPPVLWCCLTA